MTRKGLCWHVHHRIIVEFCYDYEGRVLFIRTRKEEHEQDTRLRLFQPVTGELPEEVIEAGQVCDKAGRVYGKARQAYDEVGKAYDETWQTCFEAGQACDKAWQAYDKVGKAYDEARQAYDETQQICDEVGQAYDEVLRNNMPAIMLLHKKECPNCPWDGKTIFPGT